MKGRLIQILKKLIETPTPTGGEDKLFKFLIKFLERNGFKTKVERIDYNVFNLIGERGKSEVLFEAHIDTFPAYHHREPYKLRIVDGIAIGRGVIDCKGQIASLLCAIEEVKNTGLKVAFVSDEERGGKGSENLKIKAKYALVFEPTDFKLCIAEAGAVEIEARIYGKEGHGTVPFESKNAIEQAINFYSQLKKLKFLKKTHKYFPDGGWINIGYIQGGYEPMIVPDLCILRADISILPGVNLENAIKQIKLLSQKFNAEIDFQDIEPGVVFKKDTPLIKFLRRAVKKVLNKSPEFDGMPSWTDAAYLFKKGINPVVFGAGKLHKAHSYEEKISIDELLKLKDILVQTLIYLK